MRVLIDECLPAGLKDSLVALGYEAETVRRAGYCTAVSSVWLGSIRMRSGGWDIERVGAALSFQGAVCSGAFYPPSTGSMLNSPVFPFS